LPVRTPSEVIGAAKVLAAKLAGATLVALACVFVAGCTSAQLTAFETAIATGQAALVPAEDLACTVANVVDPSGASADCQKIDSTGALVGEVFTITENAPAIANLVAKTSAGMQLSVKAHRLAQTKAVHS
jgi:hypothetical protein